MARTLLWSADAGAGIATQAESVTRRLNLSWFAKEESLSELLGWIYPNPQGYESLFWTLELDFFQSAKV